MKEYELLEKAKQLIKENKTEEAEKILRKLILNEGNNKEIYLELAKCNLDKDRQETVVNLEKYIEYGGNDSKVMILLFKLYKDFKLIDKAEKLLNNIPCKNDEYYEESYHFYLTVNNFYLALSCIEHINKLEKKEKLYHDLLKLCSDTGYYEIIKEIILNKGVCCDNKEYYLFRYYRHTGDYKAELEQIKFIQKNRCVEFYNEANRELVRHSSFDWYFSDEKSLVLLISEICFFIDYDDTDTDIVRALSVILRQKKINGSKDKILNVLEHFLASADRPRAKNIFLNELEILQKKTVLKSKPRQIIAELTTACNLKCVMCDVHLSQRNIGSNVVDFIKDCIPSAERIKWQGGEVFLYDGFTELSKMCNKYGTKQIIQTNGHLISKEKLDFLSAENIQLSFSIDSPDRETYETIRNGAKFDRLIEILELCNKYKKLNPGFKYTLIIVVMVLNYMQLDTMIDFALKYGFSGITFQKYRHNGNNKLILSAEQKKEIVLKIKEIIAKNRNSSLKILTSIPLDGSYENEKDETEKDETEKYNFSKKSSDSCKEHSAEEFNDKFKGDNSRPAAGITKSLDRIPECLSDKEIKYVKENDRIYSECSLFCAAPWTEAVFSSANTLMFGAGSAVFDMNNIEKNLIWNNEKIIEYRRKIVSSDLSICNTNCRNREDDSERIRLGLIM